MRLGYESTIAQSSSVVLLKAESGTQPRCSSGIGREVTTNCHGIRQGCSEGEYPRLVRIRLKARINDCLENS